MTTNEPFFTPEQQAAFRRELFFGDPRGPVRDKGEGARQAGPARSPVRSTGKPSADPWNGLRDIYLAEIERVVTVREGGETREIPAYVALVKAQLATALKGGAIAQRQSLDLVERFLTERNGENKASRKSWRDYIAHCERQIEDARKGGKPRPRMIPDPEDIEFCDDGTVRINGPLDEREYVSLQTLPDLLHLLLMLGAYSERFGGYRHAEGTTARTSVVSMLAHVLNKSLPPRLRLDKVEYIMALDLYDRIARRKLERMIKEQAVKAGIPRGRARIFPSVQQFADGLLN